MVTLTAYVEDSSVLDRALAQCDRYEKLLSRTVEGSDVWNINHAAGEEVFVETPDGAIGYLIVKVEHSGS